MRVADQYSFAGGEEYLAKHHPTELQDVLTAIRATDAETCRLKKTLESSRSGMLFSPRALNNCLLTQQLHQRGWRTAASRRAISRAFPKTGLPGGVRRIGLSMDGIKNRAGLEVQFGKYAFLEYDVLAKMPIYQREGLIDVGIEVVPVFMMMRQMSTGVGDFERLVTNLSARGERSGDFPVLVLGIDVDSPMMIASHRDTYKAGTHVALRGSRPGPKQMV
jgi:hypothetical protein